MFQVLLSALVQRLSLTHSVFIEEIDDAELNLEVQLVVESTDVIEHVSATTFQSLMDDSVRLKDRPTGATRHQTVLSLRSIVANLFHDRRGKITDLSKACWKSVYAVSTEDPEPAVSKHKRRRRSNLSNQFGPECVWPFRCEPELLSTVIREIVPNPPHLQEDEFRFRFEKCDENDDQFKVRPYTCTVN